MGSLPFSPYILIAALVSILLFVFTTDASKIAENAFPILDGQGYETAANSAGPTLEDLAKYAGYLTLSNTTKRMFYYLVTARTNDNTNEPLIVYLTGGPGISASLAMFYECGPLHLNNDSSLVWNEFGWDTVAHLLILDQPMGTGFSYLNNDHDIPTTTEDIVANLYNFLKAFFKKYPRLVNNELYLAGEGYAGRFIPTLTTLILNKNEEGEIHVKVKGVILQNGWMKPGRQFRSYPPYARQMNLISSTQYNETMREAFLWCERHAKSACDGTKLNLKACAQANIACNDILWDFIIMPIGDKNYYDIRKKCKGVLCYNDFSNMEKFLNQASVKEALGVDPAGTFVTWSAAVNNSMSGDVMRDFTTDIGSLLDRGIKLLAYAGDEDLICNWMGIMDTLKSIKWSGQSNFGKARNRTLIVNAEKAGRWSEYGPLTFVVVNNAGHMAAMDKQAVTLDLIRKFIKGLPL